MNADSRRWGVIWTTRQRAVVACILGAMLLLTAFRLESRPQSIPNPLNPISPRAAELLDRLDPNTASWRRLAMLPGMGQTRARAIEAYRDAFIVGHEDQHAFENEQDLAKVNGIGQATIENLRPYLIFPSRPDAP